MPAQDQDGIRALVQQETITYEQWVKILEETIGFVKPHIKLLLTSKMLGDLPLLNNDCATYAHSLRKFDDLRLSPETFEDRSLLDLRALFISLNKTPMVGENYFNFLIWGISKNGTLFLATIRGGKKAYFSPMEQVPKSVEIKTIDIDCLIGLHSHLGLTLHQHAYECWRKLKEASDALVMQRKRFLSDAESLQLKFTIQESVLDMAG